MTEKTTPVPDELLRTAKAAADELFGRFGTPSVTQPLVGRMLDALRRMPAPPPLDPVEECAGAYLRALDHFGPRGATRAALLRFKELGCPELPP